MSVQIKENGFKETDNIVFSSQLCHSPVIFPWVGYLVFFKASPLLYVKW